MSADQWSHCPRCLRQAEAVLENLSRQVDDLYGKVPVEDFDLARENLAKEQLKLENFERTFREDYDFSGAEEGVVTVTYKGGCTKCRLKLEFESEHPIPGV